jgi:hypothetical protein
VHRPALPLRPDAPEVLTAFVLSATALTTAAGSVGVAAGAGAVDLGAALGTTGSSVLSLWMALAVVIAVVLPAGVLLRWGRDPVVRRALLPYTAVLLVQVGSEATLPRLLPSWTVLVSGGLYTGFRLWQLGVARRDLAGARADTATRAGRRAAAAVLAAGLAFWAGNLAVLGASAAALVRGH